MLSETMGNAAKLLNELPDVNATPWQELAVEGRVIWNEVARAIDAADLAAFEVTHLNPNVCFELGYAIGRNKPIWPLRDNSDTTGRSMWDQLESSSDCGIRAVHQ